MSSEKNYWGPKGTLKAAQKKYYGSWQESNDSIAYASVLKDAAAKASDEARNAAQRHRYLQALVWLWRSVTLGKRALWHIDRAWTVCKDDQNFSIDEINETLDVLYRLCQLSDKCEGEAVRAILFAESMVEAGAPCAPYTYALLTCHAINFGRTPRTARDLAFVESLAKVTENFGEYAQAARVWTSVATQWEKLRGKDSDEAKHALEEATRLESESQGSV